MGKHYGVDISSIQHPNGARIDWKALYTYLHTLGGGAQPFVVVKLTEGSGYYNDHAAQDIADAIAAGFAVAVYEFNHANVGASGQLAFLRAHDPNNIPAEEDLEVTDGMSMAQVAAEGEAFLNGLGPKAMFYSYPSFLDGLPGAPWGHPLWLADPNHPLGSPSRPCMMHQAKPCPMAGFMGLVDPDVWMGSEADFAAHFVNTGLTTPSVLTPEEEQMTDGEFIREAYIKWLGRPVDPAGYTTFRNFLAANPANGREQVITQLLASPEGQNYAKVQAYRLSRDRAEAAAAGVQFS